MNVAHKPSEGVLHSASFDVRHRYVYPSSVYKRWNVTKYKYNVTVLT